MNLKFGDTNIVLKFLQIKLHEQYNPNIKVNSTYYETFNDNYGLTHFIAKYLTDMYPSLDTEAYSSIIPEDYDKSRRNLTEPISITNYFLCSNTGDKLRGEYKTNPDGTKSYIDPDYERIYGEYHNRKYIIDFLDPPILCRLENKRDFSDSKATFPDVKNNYPQYQNIYTLQNWKIPKAKCELDDYVMSYLLGRTITPRSSREEIYYVQKLLIGDVENPYRGLWVSPRGNLTELIMNYQKTCVNVYDNIPIFVTGYFDIFTEAALLRGKGEQSYGIYGL